MARIGREGGRGVGGGGGEFPKSNAQLWRIVQEDYKWRLQTPAHIKAARIAGNVNGSLLRKVTTHSYLLRFTRESCCCSCCRQSVLLLRNSVVTHFT